jgi:lipopolysaccharide export LptBFGC system permease protein LptF
MQGLKFRGQSLTELSLCLVMIVALIMAVRIYTQRSLQAKYKAGSDYLIAEIKNTAAGHGNADISSIKQQYDPYYRESNITESRSGASTVGFPKTTIDQSVTRTGQETARSAQDAD